MKISSTIFINNVHITVTSYERHGVFNRLLIDCLLNNLFKLTLQKASDYILLAIIRGIYQSPVDSPQNGLVMSKAF